MPAGLVEAGVAEDVKATLVIDLDGSVRTVEAVTASRPELAKAARTAIQGWRFQPGYVKGLPTFYRLPVTVPFRTEGTEGGLDVSEVDGKGAGVVAAPSVEWSVAPVYPPELASAPRDGLALVNVLVDAGGTPSDPVVEYASDPAFAQQARAAVMSWKYSPAERDGHLVMARVQLPVRFHKADATQTDAQRLLAAQREHAGDYDTPPEVAVQVPVVYPYDALIKNERGTASLNIYVSPDGQVVDVVPDPGTTGEFGVAAIASAACWTFHPATKMQQPVFGWVKWQLVFTEDSSEVQLDDAARELLAQLRAGTFTSTSPHELDKPITPRERIAPRLPPGLGDAATGRVMIEAIIDGNGRPQLPRILSAPMPEVGYAAATAVLRWRFEPPRKGGKPASVRVKIPFDILPAPQEPAAETPANGKAAPPGG